MQNLMVEYSPGEIREMLSAGEQKKSAEQPTATKGKLYEICKYVKFFRGVDYEDVMAIAQNIQFSRYKKGEIVVKEGEHNREIYYVIKGQCGVFKNTQGSRRKQIGAIAEGQIFGEIATLMENPRNATIAVIEEGTTILSFSLNPETSQSGYHQAYSLFFKNMARDLAIKLDETNKKFVAL